MRRLAAIITLCAVAGLIALVAGSSAQGSSTYTFNVIFDDARGLIPGQLIDIAGAKAGEISSVTVTKDFKAKVSGSISSQFQMRANARCTIFQQGLIGENYVNCDPGSPPAPILQGNPPTVPVKNTSEPVSLLDLFNIFNLPTRERFQVFIDELGIGTAGRGDDFNSILQRANPALALARQAIGILARQNSQLASIVDSTSTIASSGAAHTADVQSFLARAAALTQLTAGHTGNLQQAIARLPAMLGAAQPALAQLDTVARDGTPLLANLSTAVPYLNAVDSDIGPFARVARPALSKLSSALSTAIPAVRDAVPLVTAIRVYLGKSAPTTKVFTSLIENLQQHGFFESFFKVAYYVTSALSWYTGDGHLLGVMLLNPAGSAGALCAVYAAKSTPGCSSNYSGSGTGYTPARKAHRRAHASRSHRNRAGASSRLTTPTTSSPSTIGATTPTTTSGNGGGQRTGTTGTTGTTSTQPTTTSPTTGAGNAVQKTGQTLQNLVNYLLR